MSSGNRGCVGCLAVIAAVAGALLALFLWIIPSFEKSYTIDDVRIEATVSSRCRAPRPADASPRQAVVACLSQ